MGGARVLSDRSAGLDHRGQNASGSTGLDAVNRDWRPGSVWGLLRSNCLRKPLRYLLLLAALAVVVLVLRDFSGSRGSEVRGFSGALPVLPEEVAAQSRSWHWTQTTGDSTHIEVSADDFARGSDGRQTDLQGVVLKIFREDIGKHDRVESAAMRMLDDSTLYSEADTVIALGIPDSGGHDPEVVVITSGVTFDPATSSARTERVVSYRFDQGEGSSLGAVYDADSQTLQMLAEVQLDRFGAGPDGVPTKILAGSAGYAEQGARIDLAGGARVEQGSLWLECETAVVWLSGGRATRIESTASIGGEDGDGRRIRFDSPKMDFELGPGGELLRVRGTGGTRFESSEDSSEVEVSGDSVELTYEPGPGAGESALHLVEARGSAAARMNAIAEGLRNIIESDGLRLRMRTGSTEIDEVETLQRGRLRQLPSGEDGARRELSAGLIRVRYGERNQVDSLTASGDVIVVQEPTDEDAAVLRTWSSFLEASFDPKSASIARLHQEGAFRFEEGTRNGSAAEARFDPSGGAFELEGEARVFADGTSVAANSIALDRASGRLTAQEGVSVSVAQANAGGDEALPQGLFGAQEPVYAAAEAMISDPRAGFVEYRGAARIWQGHNRIDADTISIEQSTLMFRASGKVLTAWAERGTDIDSGTETVTVRSDGMRYGEASGEAVFLGSIDFRRAGMRLLSDELRTSLGPTEEGASRSAVATGTVRIAEWESGGGIRGFSDWAELRPAESRVVLKGSPARLVSRDGTETRGAELTLGTLGDTLHVLGRGVERAYTYHPPSR